MFNVLNNLYGNYRNSVSHCPVKSANKKNNTTVNVTRKNREHTKDWYGPLQYGMDTLILLLVRLCRAMSYVPSLRREVKAVFKPKAFRSISLTSFLVKTLEKLIHRYIEERLLQTRPLQANQYAYQQRKSKETAPRHLFRIFKVLFSTNRRL